MTPTISPTGTATPTPTATQTQTETATESATLTVTETATPTATETATATVTPSVTETSTQTMTRTVTLTATESATASVTPSSTETFTVSPTPTETPPVYWQVSVQVFDSSGHMIRSLYNGQVGGQPSNLDVGTGKLLADGTALLRVRSADGSLDIPWDGLAPDGRFVAPGIYLIQVKWSALDKPVVESRTASVAVIPSPNSGLSTLVVAPNPAGAGGAPVRFVWTPSARAAALRFRVYNIAGELVRDWQVSAAPGFTTWDLRSPAQQPIADGIYVVAAQAFDHGGVGMERVVRKLAVVRR